MNLPYCYVAIHWYLSEWVFYPCTDLKHDALAIWKILVHKIMQLFQMLIWGPSWVAQLVKNLLANAGDTRDRRFNPWVRKIPWRRKWQLAPVCLPGKFHGPRSLVGHSPWGCNESDMTEHTNVDITHTISKHHILLTLPVSLEKSLEVSITWWRKQVFQNPSFYFCSRT